MTTVRMIERADRSGYRRASTSEARRGLDAGTLRLEGADGDEATDTVTYWYCRTDEAAA